MKNCLEWILEMKIQLVIECDCKYNTNAVPFTHSWASLCII